MIQKITFVYTLLFSFLAVYANAIPNFSVLNKSLTEIKICEGQTLELTAEPATGATYQWETADRKTISKIDLIRPNVTLNMAGEYSLTISVNGCNDTAFINVIVIPKPNAGTDGMLEIIQGLEPTQQELFNALEGTPEINGTWVKKEGFYEYIVTSDFCKNKATAKVVLIENKKLVNAFTPNGDAINDTWQIFPELVKKYPNNILRVFNRHGNKVYEAKPYKNDWNAISNGKIVINNNQKLPPGPYHYILELNDKKNTVFKGWVYINY